MRKLIPSTGLALALALALSTPAHADGKLTVKGEVVDTFCYVIMGAKGASHAKCGKECAQKGIPVGLADEKGVLYVLLPPKDHSALPASVIENMGKTVSITGDSFEKGGSHFLKVESVK